MNTFFPGSCAVGAKGPSSAQKQLTYPAACFLESRSKLAKHLLKFVPGLISQPTSMDNNSGI